MLLVNKDKDILLLLIFLFASEVHFYMLLLRLGLTRNFLRNKKNEYPGLVCLIPVLINKSESSSICQFWSIRFEAQNLFSVKKLWTCDFDHMTLDIWLWSIMKMPQQTSCFCKLIFFQLLMNVGLYMKKSL